VRDLISYLLVNNLIEEIDAMTGASLPNDTPQTIVVGVSALEKS